MTLSTLPPPTQPAAEYELSRGAVMRGEGDLSRVGLRMPSHAIVLA